MTDKTADLKRLKGRLYHPSLRIFGPFVPIFIRTDAPITALLLLIPAVDFFSEPGRLSRKYIPEYQKWYISIFLCAIVARIVLLFLNTEYWVYAAIGIVVIMLLWAVFAWRSWWQLYEEAQKL
ncbi:MAG: hypothetical protein H6986_07490 [Pseudomonadales bacterium]|nr:hypothetical protein [Pseudomonadales bacterium]